MLNVFGTIGKPDAITGLDELTVLGKLIQIGIRLMIIGAGLYALINLIFAGYAFISAGEDPKKVAGAWAKIYQTILGLAVAAGAFVLAAIFSQLLFGKPDFLLKPEIPIL